MKIKCNKSTELCYLEINTLDDFTGRKHTTRYFFRKEFTFDKILKMFKVYASGLNSKNSDENMFQITTNNNIIRIDFSGKKDMLKGPIQHKKTISNIHKYSKLPYNVTRTIGKYLGESPLEPASFRKIRNYTNTNTNKNNTIGGKHNKKYTKRTYKRKSYKKL
jgi:hypothetical protein